MKRRSMVDRASDHTATFTQDEKNRMMQTQVGGGFKSTQKELDRLRQTRNKSQNAWRTQRPSVKPIDKHDMLKTEYSASEM